MKNASSPLLSVIATWSPAAQTAFHTLTQLFRSVAKRDTIGALDETLKWGQPSWRPKRPRTGSTIRMDWREDTPDQLALFVDCKTDLAARMQTLYPDLPSNDGRRRIVLDLNAPLPEQAISHLAEMTFCYHQHKTKPATG